MQTQIPELNPGIYGAKVKSWKANSRQFMLRIINENPGLTIVDYWKLFYEEIVTADDIGRIDFGNREDLFNTILQYSFRNDIRALLGRSVSKEERETIRQERVEEKKASEARAKTAAANLAAAFKRKGVKDFLNWIAPNGKAFQKCTKEEILDFHENSWCLIVAKWLKKGQTPEEAGISNEKILKAFFKG